MPPIATIGVNSTTPAPAIVNTSSPRRLLNAAQITGSNSSGPYPGRRPDTIAQQHHRGKERDHPDQGSPLPRIPSSQPHKHHADQDLQRERHRDLPDAQIRFEPDQPPNHGEARRISDERSDRPRIEKAHGQHRSPQGESSTPQ